MLRHKFTQGQKTQPFSNPPRERIKHLNEKGVVSKLIPHSDKSRPRTNPGHGQKPDKQDRQIERLHFLGKDKSRTRTET